MRDLLLSKLETDQKTLKLIQIIKARSGGKNSLLLLSTTTLAACGGGTSGGGGGGTPPPPVVTPGFTQSGTTYTGTSLAETLSESANTANLTVNGLGGNDTVTTGSGNDTIDGGSGNDTIDAGDGTNNITGGSGDDVITSGAGDDTIDGGSGADTITSGDGANVILGGTGGDTITGGAGVDWIRGGTGADTIQGGDGDDFLVVVGETVADQYTSSSITNPAGTDRDLSSLIALSNLNNQSTSEVVEGESIDGGAGTNTLYVYGTVDFTGVTITNITQVVVNSDVTFTDEQLGSNGITTITGDGGSTIRLSSADGETATIDLSTLDLTGVNRLDVGENVTVVASDVTTLTGSGISVVSGSGALQVTDATGSANLAGIAVAEGTTVQDAAGTEIDKATTGATVVTQAQADTASDPTTTNAAPTDIALSAAEVAENAAGAEIGTLTTIDADEGDVHTYTVNDERFEVADGKLKLKAGQSLDHEAAATLDIIVTVKDLKGSKFEKTFTMTIEDVEDAPILTSSKTVKMAENQSTVLTVTATKAENSSLTYSISGDDEALFNIDPNTGVLSFKSAPDYENPQDLGGNNVYNLIVTATDATNQYDLDSLTITIENVNEVHEITSSSFETSEEQTLVWYVRASDPEGAALSYSISGSDSEWFDINSSTGKLTFKNAVDYENPVSSSQANKFTFTVTVKDTLDNSVEVSKEITVNVRDVQETIAGFSMPGANNRYVGSGVSAGDINGDGIDDIIIGAKGGDGDFKGFVYVVYGTASDFSTTFDLNSLNGSNGFKINGEEAGDYVGGNFQSFYGQTFTSGGDINGDGVDDLLIGAVGAEVAGKEKAGKVYVLFGNKSGFSPTFELSSLDGANGFTILGETSQGSLGFSISFAGDVNGDGIEDMIIGAFSDGDVTTSTTNKNKQGKAYVVFGSKDGFPATIDVSSLDGSKGFKLIGPLQEFKGDFTVSNAGDINGDGIDDLLIGSPNASPRDNYLMGEAYVVYGKSGGFEAEIDLTKLDGSNGFTIQGTQAKSGFGYYITGAGDFNGDGVDDIALGQYSNQSNHNIRDVYIIYGKKDGFSSVLDLSEWSESDGLKITSNGIHNVTSIMDLNGDGMTEIAYERGGYVYVVFGSKDGFEGDFQFEELNGVNGFVINTVKWDKSKLSSGDFNNDGYNDLLIGIETEDYGGSIPQGTGYVVFGHGGNWAASYDVADLVSESSLNQSSSSSSAVQPHALLDNFVQLDFTEVVNGNAEGISDYDLAQYYGGEDEVFSAAVDVVLEPELDLPVQPLFDQKELDYGLL